MTPEKRPEVPPSDEVIVEPQQLVPFDAELFCVDGPPVGAYVVVETLTEGALRETWEELPR